MAPRTFPHFFSLSLSRALLENELESHASLLLLPLFIVAVREEGEWPEIPIPAIFPMEGKAGCPDLEQISFGFPPPSSCPHQDCVARGVETKRALCGSFFSFLFLMALLLITFYARASLSPPPSLPLPLTSPFCPHFLTEKRGGGEGDGRWKGGGKAHTKAAGKERKTGERKVIICTF